MLAGIPTRQRLFCQLEEIDVLLKELLEKINRKVRFDDIEHIVLSLLEKDKGIKETMKTVSEQMELQKKIEKLRADCSNSDLQINACQKQLKKQKLDAMVKAVKNPTDVDDLVRLAHRISCSYGVLAPDNWGPGDPRRPYPNKEEIRRGYLGHLDDSGNFLPTLQDAIAQFHSSVPTTLASVLATPAAAEITPTQSILTAYSPSVSVSGVNVVPSPSGTAPPTGSGNHWLDQQQQLRHLPSSSLTAILPSGSGVNAGIRPPRSGLQESPSSRAIWQQHMRQGLLGAHSSNPPQTKKRPHIEDPKMYSDTSSDDDGRFSDFTHHAL
uniref:Mediator of RNA polymerase II transcription subunit 4 n=1 Tax=Echinococcus granulosus TaxID=6210 RepID=A0A068WEN8_ECHGR|nr:mediator complex subunit [Echinococcus granulosus]